MDHREFVSALPSDLRERMVEKQDGPGMLHLAGHLGRSLSLAV